MQAFARFFLFFFAILAVAVARPKPGGHSGIPTPTTTAAPTPTSQCNTGSIMCCQSVQRANSNAASELLDLLGIVLGNTNTDVGLTCSPLTIIGLGGGSECNASPVCCQNNQFNGIIAVGCSPINLNL